MALKLYCAIAASFLFFCAVPRADAQGGPDDYACQHGNPADSSTAAACERLGMPIPSSDDRLDQADPAPTQPIAGEESADFQRGLADRQHYEAWFHGLQGDYLAGATYWESNRSIRNAPDCLTEGAAASAAWRAGCLADQASLRESDALRHSSPYFRQGWNSYQEPAAASPGQEPSARTAAPAQSNDVAAAPAPATLPATPTESTRPAPGNSGASIAGAMAVALIALTLYVLPTLIAIGRQRQNAVAIFALNLFLGWTFLGWVVALVWSLSSTGSNESAVPAAMVSDAPMGTLGSKSETFAAGVSPPRPLPLVLIVGGVVVLIVAVCAAVFMREGVRSFQPSMPASSPAPPVDPSVAQRPGDEVAFLDAVRAGKAAYESANNDMAKGGTRGQRKAAICAALKSLDELNWTGHIVTLSSNSEGKGVLAIDVGDGIQVQTWNNALSDIGDQTLIESNTDLFKTIEGMSPGDPIRFSGSFFQDDTDCVRELSFISLDGSMTNPQFLMRFTDVAKL